MASYKKTVEIPFTPMSNLLEDYKRTQELPIIDLETLLSQCKEDELDIPIYLDEKFHA